MKKAAVINDLSGFGKCSLSATIPILSAMGVQPCAMPTAVLTNQTGFKNHFCVDLTDSMPKYIEMWKRNNESFDAIYSGYVAGEKQIDIIADFINAFKGNRTMVLVDPVMGDNGAIYSSYTQATCKKMCSLIKKADVITPNLTELCIIAEKDYNEICSDTENTLEIVSETAKSVITHSEQKVLVTGIKTNGFIYNGVFSEKGEYFTRSKDRGTGFSGTGDIFASVVCGAVTNGEPIEKAVQNATRFIELAIDDTVSENFDPNYGVNFEKFLNLLFTKEKED